MYSNKKRDYITHSIFGIIFFALFLLQYSAGFSLGIGSARAMVLLPCAMVAAILFGEWIGAFYGLIIGTMADICSTGPIMFNAIVFFVLSVLVGLAVSYYFNNNFFSVLTLNVIVSIIYFLIKLLFFEVFNSTGITFTGVINNYLLSALLTSALAMPIYLICKFILKRMDGLR